MSFDFGFALRAIPLLAEGLWTTLALAVPAVALSALWGVAVVVGLLSRRPALAAVTRGYVEVVRNTPVLAGVNGTDPFMLTDRFLREIADLGFSGVQNFPTVGLIDGTFRANLEETGMGYGLEVEMIRRAAALDLLTTPYVFSEAEARAMAQAGADVIVCHLGLTTGGAIGAETALTLADSVERIRAWGAAALAVRPEVIVMCHGGPIAQPEDAAWVLARCPDCHGFYGASSMERLPTEQALTEQTRRFVAIRR